MSNLRDLSGDKNLEVARRRPAGGEVVEGSNAAGGYLIAPATSLARFSFLAFFLSFLAFFTVRISSVTSPPPLFGEVVVVLTPPSFTLLRHEPGLCLIHHLRHNHVQGLILLLHHGRGLGLAPLLCLAGTMSDPFEDVCPTLDLDVNL